MYSKLYQTPDDPTLSDSTFVLDFGFYLIVLCTVFSYLFFVLLPFVKDRYFRKIILTTGNFFIVITFFGHFPIMLFFMGCRGEYTNVTVLDVLFYLVALTVNIRYIYLCVNEQRDILV